MPRSLTTAVRTAMSGSYVRTAHLFRAIFTNSSSGQDEVYHFTDNFRDVEWNGETYQALGHLLGIAGVEENADFQITTATITLSAVDLAMISTLLQYRYIDRSMEIWRVFFSIPAAASKLWNDAGEWDTNAIWEDYGRIVSTDELIADPVKLFTGAMSDPAIVENPDVGNCTVTLTASSLFSDFDRRPGRHTNHQEQQAYFPGDLFFRGWGNPDQELVWGKA